TDSGAEKRLIRVDIPNTMQQFLVKQCGFNRSLASAKEPREIVTADRERFSARSGKAFFRCYAQSAKASWIYESELASRGERSNGVSMLGSFFLASTHQHAPGHSKMHDPLSCTLSARCSMLLLYFTVLG